MINGDFLSDNDYDDDNDDNNQDKNKVYKYSLLLGLNDFYNFKFLILWII